MKSITAMVTLALLCSACTSARISRNLSSGAIGCPANQIIIHNETADVVGNHNWEAECKGRRYICSYHTSTGVNCTEKQ